MRRDGIDPEFLEAIPADHLAHRLQHTLFGSIPVTFGIVVLRHMLLLGNKYTSFSRINAIFGKNLHFQHKIRKNPQKDPDSRANREPPDYNSSNIPAGLSTMCRAPASSSSARSRNPHVTPTERTPAAAAVCMSTPESPT